MFWSAALVLFAVVVSYFNWRERKNMHAKVAQTMDEIRSIGLSELRKVIAGLEAEKQALLEDVARHRDVLTKNATGI